MAIPQSTIDAIRERSDIVDVVGARVELRRAGTNFKGLCPFHDEKTPSFNVNPERQIFHCFGCGKGGNVFTFLMETEGVTFPEAVRVLGRRCGIEVEEERISDAERSRNDALFEANRMAAHFYHRCLLAEEGRAARDYLEGRGIGPEAWKRFGLGYAPDAWDRLAGEARRRRIKADVLSELRLIIAREKSKGYYDYFRNRIMFPIVKTGGRVVAFGARAMGNDEPKYLNSAESPIFAKRRTFYGMDRAREAIRTAKRAIVVEGYTDLISLHQAGLDEAVAACGTALTPQHASALRRLTQQVVLLPDADNAGENAALTAGAVLLAAGLDVSVARLEAGMDPDTAARSLTTQELAQLIDNSMDYFQNLAYIVTDRRPSMREREAMIRRIVTSISHLDDPLRHDVIIKELAGIFGVDPAGLKRVGSGVGARVRSAPDDPSPDRRDTTGRVQLERLALRLILEGSAPALEALESLDTDDFSDADCIVLYKLLDSARHNDIDIRSQEFQRQVEEFGLEQFEAEIVSLTVPPGNVSTLLKDTIRRIKILKIRDELSVLQHTLRGLAPDSEEAAAMGEHYRRLSKALEEL